MLPILTVIIAILAPFIHSRIPTEAEIEAGKVDGFTGDTNSRFGDYLLSTTCFCGFEGSGPTSVNKRAILRLYEYYQYHHNTTYMVKDFCLDTSSPDCSDNKDTYDEGYISVCDTWIVEREHKHTLCYLRDVKWIPEFAETGLPMADKIKFDKFTRGLGARGGQAPYLRSVEEADARCDVLCEQQTGSPVLKEHLEMAHERLSIRNHMIAWEDLDDMCDGCK